MTRSAAVEPRGASRGEPLTVQATARLRNHVTPTAPSASAAAAPPAQAMRVRRSILGPRPPPEPEPPPCPKEPRA